MDSRIQEDGATPDQSGEMPNAIAHLSREDAMALMRIIAENKKAAIAYQREIAMARSQNEREDSERAHDHKKRQQWFRLGTTALAGAFLLAVLHLIPESDRGAVLAGLLPSATTHLLAYGAGVATGAFYILLKKRQ